MMDMNAARLDGLTEAERTKDAMDEDEKLRLAWIYSKPDDKNTLDPDKRRLVRSKPRESELEPSTTGSNATAAFDGELAFLGSMARCTVQLPGDTTRFYPSVEHALQASKTTDGAVRDAIVACTKEAHGKTEAAGLAAKRIGGKLLGKGNSEAAKAWRDASTNVMLALLRDKFKRNPKVSGRGVLCHGLP